MSTVAPEGPFDRAEGALGTSAPGRGSLPLRHRQVAALLTQLATTARAFLLYDVGNDAVRRSLRALLDAFAATLAAEAHIRLDVRPFEIAFEGKRHLLSVCQLSLMLGRSLGLGEAALGDLGVAALLHDIGYLNSRDPVRHALAGGRLLAATAGVQRGQGPPAARRPRAPHGRTRPAQEPVQLVRPHSARGRRVRPAGRSALRVTPAGGARHRPRADVDGARSPLRPEPAGPVRAGARLLPPGTLLELSDGSLALTVRAGTGHERWARPVVRVVRAADGTVGPQPAEVDLFERPEEPAPRVVEPGDLEPPIAAACRASLVVSTG